MLLSSEAEALAVGGERICLIYLETLIREGTIHKATMAAEQKASIEWGRKTPSLGLAPWGSDPLCDDLYGVFSTSF